MIFLVPVTCKKVRLSLKHTGRFLSVYFQQCLTIYGPIKSESKFSFHPPIYIYIHSDPFCLKKNVMRWEVCSTTKLTLGKKEIEQNRLHRSTIHSLFLHASLPVFFSVCLCMCYLLFSYLFCPIPLPPNWLLHSTISVSNLSPLHSLLFII